MDILLISTLYPEPKKYGLMNDTKAVHYFAREWVKMGHRVLVFHPYRNPLHKFISYRCGIKFTNIDGVNIAFGQNQLLIPHKNVPFAFQQEYLANKFLRYIRELFPHFVPDIVSVHFPLCSLPFAETVLRGLNFVGNVAYVYHWTDINLLQKMTLKQREIVIKRLCNDSTRLLYRSYQLKNIANSLGVPKLGGDVVLSGIDSSLIATDSDIKRKWGGKVSDNTIHFVYAGRLIRRKHVDRIIKVLASICKDVNFTFTIIGDGDQRTKLEELVKEYGLCESVRFLGQQTREAVVKSMFDSDVFVMVSENETLGLVYLEAMAQGCIPIGSRGEGIDGIIVSGQNGYLVNPNKENDLRSILLEISNLSYNEKANMARQAYDTARIMTSYNMAKKYINCIQHVQ